MPGVKSYAATVEDGDSDADAAVVESSTTKKSPRRPPPVSTSRNVAVDAASDSGYSSRTAATIASADSVDVPVKPAVKPGATALRLDRPTPAAVDSRKEKPLPLHELKPPSRPSSRPAARSMSRPSADQRFQRCTDSDCMGCYTRPNPSPLELSAWNPQYARHPPSPTHSSHLPPPSPHPYNQPAAYQPTAAPYVTVAAPRRPPAGSRRRPLSYHPGMVPDGYWVPVGPTSAYDHRPPPAPSAYANPLMTASPYSVYAQPQAVPASPVYPPQFQTYPPLQAMTPKPRSIEGYITPSAYDTLKPVSYEPVSYEPNGYTTALVRRASNSRRSPGPSGYDMYYSNDVDRQRMPPPPRPGEAPRPRPPTRTRSSSQRAAEKSPYHRNSDSSSSDADATIRARSTRPRQSSVYEKSARDKSNAREYIESSRERRSSYASHEQQREPDRRGSTKSEPHPGLLRRTRTISRPTRLTEEALLDAKDDDVNTQRQSRSRSRVDPSHEGSVLSKSGTGPEGLKIKVDRNGINLNMNGQRISVMPKENGTADLIIGGAQKHEVRVVEETRPSSSGGSSSRRKSRSSKSSSEVGGMLAARRGTVAASDES